MPFAPRPPGPSGGRLAIRSAAGAAPLRGDPAAGPQEFALEYDFNMAVMGRHAAVLSQIVEYANATGAGACESPRLADRHCFPMAV